MRLEKSTQETEKEENSWVCNNWSEGEGSSPLSIRLYFTSLYFTSLLFSSLHFTLFHFTGLCLTNCLLDNIVNENEEQERTCTCSVVGICCESLLLLGEQ